MLFVQVLTSNVNQMVFWPVYCVGCFLWLFVSTSINVSYAV